MFWKTADVPIVACIAGTLSGCIVKISSQNTIWKLIKDLFRLIYYC
jgi:hypothetical protein